MKTNVRLLALALSVLMLFCLTACGGGEDTSTPADSSDVSADVDAPVEDNTTDSSTPVEEDNNPDTATTTKGKVTTTKGKVTTTKKNDNKTPVKNDTYVQSQFHIGTFTVGGTTDTTQEQFEKIVKLHKEAGFTLIENAFKGRETGLQSAAACEKIGINFLMQNYTDDMGYSGIGSQYPEFKESVVKTVVKEMEDYEYFEGWYTWDEVGIAQFGELKKVNDWFKKHDPDKAVFCITLPSYGGYKWNYSKEDNWKQSDYYDYVTRYVKEVDPPIIGFDYYPFQYHGGKDTDLKECAIWRDMGLFRNLSLETGKPFWFYYQAYNAGDNYTFTNEMRLVQAYAGIAYGAKMLSPFNTLRQLVADAYGNKAPEFDDIKEVNRLTKNLGDYLFKKTNEELYHFGVSSRNQVLFQLDDVSKSDLIVDGPKGTIVSVFGDGTAKKYVLVVNKEFKGSKKGTLTLKANKKVSIYDHNKNKTFKISSSTKTIDVALPAGECALYIVE